MISFQKKRWNSIFWLTSCSLIGTPLACGTQSTLPGSNESGDSLLATISAVHSDVKNYSLEYRLYCGTNEKEISEKIQAGTVTDKVTDRSDITNSTLKFSGPDTKKLSDGAKCVLDIYSGDTTAHSRYQWSFFDKNNNPVKGVFYITSPASLTNKKLSLTLYATYIDSKDTFEAEIKTTYPKDQAGKSASSVYLSCGSSLENNLGSSEGTTLDSNSIATHKFNLRKSDFKDADRDCSLKSSIDGQAFKSTSSFKILKNPNGQKTELQTEVSRDGSTSSVPQGTSQQGASPQGSSSQGATTQPPTSAGSSPQGGGSTTGNVTVEISFQNAVCETIPGISGCIP